MLSSRYLNAYIKHLKRFDYNRLHKLSSLAITHFTNAKLQSFNVTKYNKVSKCATSVRYNNLFKNFCTFLFKKYLFYRLMNIS